MSQITTKNRTTTQTLLMERQLYEWTLMQSNGEITPELEALEIELSKNIAKKVDAIYHYITRLESLANQDLEDSRQFANAARSKTRAIERLKDMVKYHMEKSGIHEIASESTTFKLIQCQMSLDIDEEKLPSEYWKETIKREPNKEFIKECLKRGESVPGAKLYGGFSLKKGLGRKY